MATIGVGPLPWWCFVVVVGVGWQAPWTRCGLLGVCVFGFGRCWACCGHAAERCIHLTGRSWRGGTVLFILLGLLVLPEWSHAATACVDVQAPVESPVQYASRCFGIIGYKVQVNTVPAAWPLTCTKDMEDFVRNTA